MLSTDLSNTAQTLEAKRQFACALPYGGSFWSILSLSEADTLIAFLREAAERAAALEAQPAPTRHGADPASRPRADADVIPFPRRPLVGDRRP